LRSEKLLTVNRQPSTVNRQPPTVNRQPLTKKAPLRSAFMSNNIPIIY